MFRGAIRRPEFDGAYRIYLYTRRQAEALKARIGDPAYPLKLFQRVITVSLETMKIVRSLPPLDIMPENGNAETPTTH